MVRIDFIGETWEETRNKFLANCFSVQEWEYLKTVSEFQATLAEARSISALAAAIEEGDKFLTDWEWANPEKTPFPRMACHDPERRMSSRN